MLGRARLSGPAGPLLGVAVGLLAAGALTLLQDSTYRADASIVLVRQGQPPGSDPRLAEAAETAAELFDSRAVAESAIRNLGLRDSPQELLDRIDVEAQEGSSLVRIHVEGPSREQARRAAQEVSEVATVLFNDRFAPQTVASVWEPAALAEGRVSPKPARNLALGGVLGALAGLALVLAGMRASAAVSPPVPPETESLPVPLSVSAADPPVSTEPRGPFIRPRRGSWTVADVERLLAGQGDAFPDRLDELNTYLDSFRSVADEFGRFPGDVELVVEDVFEALIHRALSGQPSRGDGHTVGDAPGS